MIGEFIEAFVLVFAAEVGDKTQLMLMTLSAKYSIIQMLLGILLGVVLNHGAAVYIGCFLSNMINNGLLQMFAGIMFIIFGIITIVFDDENEKERNFKFGPIITTALTFFLGEIGDKTQLTAMTLAMEGNYPIVILAGSVTGMLAIGMVGIIIGTSLTKHIPSYIIKIISGLVFIIFGVMRLNG
ncbi:MAG: TMEM165/GDT1 family protein [Sedimentibacter sp.]